MPYLSALEVCHDKALYKSMFTLPYLTMHTNCSSCHSFQKKHICITCPRFLTYLRSYLRHVLFRHLSKYTFYRSRSN